MIDLLSLESYCNEVLQVDEFNDYCPNGLQVEAAQQVEKLMLGVTACQALIQAAEEWGADALLVHHGYFWKGEGLALRGLKANRVGALFRQRTALLAYHLPLDAHQTYGNNRQLGERLGLLPANPVAEGSLIWQTSLSEPISVTELTQRIADRLHRRPTHIAPNERPLKRIGWCTGAAQDAILEAAGQGLDAYISGEISEQTVHLARELGIHYFAAGHHATERYGVQALGRHLAERFSLEYRFVDVENPV
ncbi:MAG: Nif3-like dinuclear metal center hexameric protein [gamma proteobacterium symbiont of Ctena orbiculata]|nr:MAG: Nif3-like dinuclear metal center hexameric protein [gamma proteobacterium symbiont of Ctena orbiculata]PVV20717.1 MAG: Nif3-like dinuclear metal center hexameric protein [gamma proteobacterium symbiont of Ctena orbiculata]PVV26218.1 MAG: Nif3-like dinuclear metal center hexameric protein [gamma proteobacterium symbiont of Ctena orbiculata]